MRPDFNEYRLYVIITLLSGAVLTVLYLKHPSEYRMIPPCPFHFLLGLYCPGCGTLRAIHYLLHGHITTAFRYQPLAMLLFPVVIFLFGKRLYEFYRQKTVQLPFEVSVYWGIFFIICIFFAARNIPLDFLNWLRPPLE
ncbi:MAG: DUF2752 domain-containing protein [Planctomycetaceae bacterium]|jgi:hypothetical protein|nr:DUF2752 domain-containing protein [Planctomycetaceae bacterium]